MLFAAYINTHRNTQQGNDMAKLTTIEKNLKVQTVMGRTGCTEKAARAELAKFDWYTSDAIQSLKELATAKRVQAGRDEALQLNIDAAQRELNRRAAEGEDVSHLRVCQETTAIVPLDAKTEAIANADAHTSNVGLPTYTELVEALRKHQQFNDGHSFVEISSVTDRKFKALGKESAALLARIPA